MRGKVAVSQTAICSAYWLESRSQRRYIIRSILFFKTSVAEGGL